MRLLLRIYFACSVIVIGFFAFFSIPWSLLPFSDAVNVMVAGGVVTAVAGLIFARDIRSGRFEFGWFLSNRGGFWIIVAAAVGLLTLLCGTLLFVSPELFVPAFEQGALPLGMIVVSMFWIALIFLFGFLAFQMLADVIVQIRNAKIGGAVAGFAIGAFCLFLAGVFFSLYLDVINDNAIRIAEAYRWGAAWSFAAVLAAAALANGLLIKSEEVDSTEKD